MEWILIIGGIAWSLWSSYKKEQREREQKMPQRQRPTSRTVADEMFARSSGRRTISHDAGAAKPYGQDVTNAYGQDVSRVEEVTLEDLQEDFTTRLNRKLLEQNMAREAQGYESFADSAVPETSRYRDYDDLPSYDQRPTGGYSTEHAYASHFKLNEGLRKDSFKVGNSEDSDIDFADDVYEKPNETRRAAKFSREQLKSFVVMHEVLGKPRALRQQNSR